MTEQAEAKTIGYTPFHYCSDRPLFRVNGGVPLNEALQQASDLLHLAYRLAEDATFERKTDRHAWAAHYLMEMSKAVIDDVVKVMTVRPEGQNTPIANGHIETASIRYAGTGKNGVGHDYGADRLQELKSWSVPEGSPKTGEMNLMKYYETDSVRIKFYRPIASESDVQNLIYISKRP